MPRCVHFPAIFLVLAMAMFATPVLAEKAFIPVADLYLPKDLKLLNLDDQVSDIPSGTPLLINLWASWCGPCLEELPALNRLRQTISPQELGMLALNYGDTLPKVRRFVTANPIDFPILMDLTTLYSQRLKPLGLPTTYLVDSQGQIRFRFEGKADWGSPQMIAHIKARLEELQK